MYGHWTLHCSIFKSIELRHLLQTLLVKMPACAKCSEYVQCVCCWLWPKGGVTISQAGGLSSILLSGGHCAGLLYLAMSGSVWKLCSDRGRPRGGVPCLKKSRNQFRLYTATASRAPNEPSWRFHNHGEGPFLVLSPYYERLQVLFENSYKCFFEAPTSNWGIRHYAK